MTKSELLEVIDSWLAYNELEQDDPAKESYWWAVDKVMTWNIENPELVWEFIVLCCKNDLSDKAVQNLAAGPLEDLLVSHGAEFIGRISEHAKKDEAMRELLGGVWQNDMLPEVWAKVQSMRKRQW